MFVQVEVLHRDGDGVDYHALGLEPPEDILMFSPVWLNLNTVSHFAPADNPGETIISLTNGRNLQINMPEENLLLLLDTAGLLLQAEKFPLIKKAS